MPVGEPQRLAPGAASRREQRVGLAQRRKVSGTFAVGGSGAAAALACGRTPMLMVPVGCQVAEPTVPASHALREPGDPGAYQ